MAVASAAETPVGEGIHPSAIIDRTAELGEGVAVGPYSSVGPGVTVGAGTSIGSHVVIERDTEVGEECRISHGAILGTDPQDLKYAGEETRLRVGDRTTIREYATLNRGTAATGITIVGDDCMLMAYVHVAHDCVLGDHVILSNSVHMAGPRGDRGLGDRGGCDADPPVRADRGARLHRRRFARGEGRSALSSRQRAARCSCTG